MKCNWNPRHFTIRSLDLVKLARRHHVCVVDLRAKVVIKKYKFNNYVKTIELSRAQLSRWRSNKDIHPKPLDRAEILRVEKATRGQSKNELWTLLRLDRSTASASSNSSGNMLQRPALLFGNAQESQVKETNGIMLDHMREIIKNKITSAVVETVLDCGMFFSSLGLHAASPDAYFSLADGTWIPVEIKCPYNYRDTTVEQMRVELGNGNRKYRVKHTALLVNKKGTPQFEMVKTDAHYKQIQRQMYVMNAPMGFTWSNSNKIWWRFLCRATKRSATKNCLRKTTRTWRLPWKTPTASATNAPTSDGFRSKCTAAITTIVVKRSMLWSIAESI